MSRCVVCVPIVHAAHVPGGSTLPLATRSCRYGRARRNGLVTRGEFERGLAAVGADVHESHLARLFGALDTAASAGPSSPPRWTARARCRGRGSA